MSHERDDEEEEYGCPYCGSIEVPDGIWCGCGEGCDWGEEEEDWEDYTDEELEELEGLEELDKE